MTVDLSYFTTANLAKASNKQLASWATNLDRIARGEHRTLQCRTIDQEDLILEEIVPMIRAEQARRVAEFGEFKAANTDRADRLAARRAERLAKLAER